MLKWAKNRWLEIFIALVVWGATGFAIQSFISGVVFFSLAAFISSVYGPHWVTDMIKYVKSRMRFRRQLSQLTHERID